MKIFLAALAVLVLSIGLTTDVWAQQGSESRVTPAVRILQAELSPENVRETVSRIPEKYFHDTEYLKGDFVIVMVIQAFNKKGFEFKTHEELNVFTSKFWADNPGLLNGEGLVPISRLVDISQNPGIFAPAMEIPTATVSQMVKTSATATTPASTPRPQSANQPTARGPAVDEEARYRSNAANRSAENAVEIAVRTSAEMEKFAAQHRGNFQQVNQLKTQGTETVASLNAVKQTVDSHETAIDNTVASLATLQQTVDSHETAIDNTVASLAAMQQTVDGQTSAVQSINLMWVAVGGLVAALIALFFFNRRHTNGIEGRLGEKMDTRVRETVKRELQLPLANFRARIDELEDDVRAHMPEFRFPADFKEQLQALSKAFPAVVIKINVGDKPILLKFRAVKPGYVTIEGINKMNRADLVAIGTMERTLKRQWALNRIMGYVQGPEEVDESDAALAKMEKEAAVA